MIDEELEIVYAVKDMVKIVTGEWVGLSDLLRIQGAVACKGDVALVRSFDNGNKVVVDIKKQHKETADGIGDLDTQIKQFSRLQGGY